MLHADSDSAIKKNMGKNLKSLLPTFSKIVEKILIAQLLKFLELIIWSNQF